MAHLLFHFFPRWKNAEVGFLGSVYQLHHLYIGEMHGVFGLRGEYGDIDKVDGISGSQCGRIRGNVHIARCKATGDIFSSPRNSGNGLNAGNEVENFAEYLSHIPLPDRDKKQGVPSHTTSSTATTSG
jgi:hypothetical protein